jgi:hypothetical protein
MTTSYLALTALLTVAAPAEGVLLTPDTIAEQGFHLQCYVVDKPDEVAKVRETPLLRPRGPMVVRLRFGLLQKGPYAVLAKDLEAIRGVCLVVRDGDAVQQSIPLRVKVDPGNVVHLYTHFSWQKDLLSKTQLVFDGPGKDGKRTFIVDLKEFIK